MAKGPTFNTITAAFASASKLNANNALVVTAFDNTLSRDGSTPNAMAADLDMDSNDILNAGDIAATDITIGGTSLVAQVTAAATSATASATSATASASSATASADSATDASASAAIAAEDVTRNEIALATIDASVDFLRTSGYAVIGDGGEGHYKRVGSEPSHNLKVTSLDGAFWELVPNDDGYINVKQAGAVGDNTTDDGQAFIDALDYGNYDVATQRTTTNGVRVIPSVLPYYLGANTLELKKNVHFVGQGGGFTGGNSCILRWDANITGIIVHQFDTIGATTESDDATKAGTGSTIQGLELQGGGGTIAGVTDSTKGHGIWLRSRARLLDLQIKGFAGNGVNIFAGAGGGGATEGNANLWSIDRAQIINNFQSGIFIDGADVNAGGTKNCNISANGRWGIWDTSFLGNTHINNHASSNGLGGKGENTTEQSSFVHLSGVIYAANVNASEADLVATTPGTDETVWYNIKSGSDTDQTPTWLTSQSEGTYFHGGPYHTDSANSRCVFVGNYVEGDQGPPQFVTPTIVFGGFGFGNTKGTAVTHQVDEIIGQIQFPNHKIYDSTPASLFLEINPGADKLIAVHATGDHSSGMTFLGWEDTDALYHIGQNENSSRRPIKITTTGTTEKFARDAEVLGGEVVFPRGLFVGSSLSGSRNISNNTSLRTSGDRAKGDIELNRNAASGAPAGWLCTTGHATTPTFTGHYGVGTQQSAITDANVAHDVNSTFSDVEVETALDILGTRINSLIAALEHFGFTAT